LGSRDRELFDLQNDYFYNILKVKVKAGKAKVIVNQHAIDLDGRKAWRKFIHYFEQKGVVTLNKAHFFEKLSSMRLSVNYRGGPSKFLTDFETVEEPPRIKSGSWFSRKRLKSSWVSFNQSSTLNLLSWRLVQSRQLSRCSNSFLLLSHYGFA